MEFVLTDVLADTDKMNLIIHAKLVLKIVVTVSETTLISVILVMKDFIYMKTNVCLNVQVDTMDIFTLLITFNIT